MERISSNISETKISEKWYEVSEDEIQSVAENLIKFWPESLNVYNFITENVVLSRKSGRTKTQLFQNKQNGLLIVIMKGAYSRATIFSSEKNYSGIESALQDNKIINWRDGSVLLCGISLDLLKYLKDICPSTKTQLYHDNIYDYYWMSAEVAKALNIECPDDMYFAKLDDCHADIVNSTWRYGSNETLVMVSYIIKFMDTVGLFTKNNSKPVAWVLNTNYGIGMLYTIEEHRKKGYGTLVVKKLAKILGQSGKNPILVTLQDNLTAKSVFCKSGFVFIGPLVYAEIKEI